MNIKRITPILLLLIIILPINLHAGLFEDYDFTFYKTISQTLTSFDKNSNIGLDYTGFGFLGESDMNGTFVRFGIQFPYSVFMSRFFSLFGDTKATLTTTDTTNSSSNTSLDTGSNTTSTTISTGDAQSHRTNIEESEITFTFIVGPALRAILSNQVSCYLGTGFRIEQNNNFVSNALKKTNESTYTSKIGFDFDVGGRIDVTKRSSIRIGFYGTTDLISYTYTEHATKGSQEEDVQTDSSSKLLIHFLNFGENKATLNITGYISLGTHFSSNWNAKTYSYTTTSSELFQGTLKETKKTKRK